MNTENASGARGTQMKIYKNSERRFEVRLHGEQSIFSKMQEQNDRLLSQSGFIGTMSFLSDDPLWFIEKEVDGAKHMKKLNRLILISSLQELT